ncbi:MAG TPA: hypothetical protein VKE69_12435 [Planctomycetota bacterium]|nr:hypothetical protein [Planctomycetota bacterium]
METPLPIDPHLATAVAVLQGAFYAVAIGGILAAVLVYRRNSEHARSRWISTIYERFYEIGERRRIREILDTAADSEDVRALVETEEADFTDYLAFLEHVCYLLDAHQVEGDDVEALFEYYLSCLRRHSVVRAYVRNPELGYERLRRRLEPPRPGATSAAKKP